MSNIIVDPKALIEGERPAYNTSYGKLMMWFFLVSDAFTFSALLIAYGALRVSSVSEGIPWAFPEQVYTHTPFLTEFLHVHAPLVFVGIMTFILIVSSVTMVLAVEAGHRRSKKEVAYWMLLTIIGGAAFLACQGYEWYHFIHGTAEGALKLADGRVAHWVNGALTLNDGTTVAGALGIDGSVWTDFAKNAKDGMLLLADGRVATPVEEGLKLASGTVITENAATLQQTAVTMVHGANMTINEYGPPAFANLFFFVTGFHGTHVLSGVIINIIIYLNVLKGTYEERGHYEMIEKVGLYWHFVDLVWVFVFTFFYLV